MLTHYIPLYVRLSDLIRALIWLSLGIKGHGFSKDQPGVEPSSIIKYKKNIITINNDKIYYKIELNTIKEI